VTARKPQRRTFVIRLVVESSDGPAAFDYFQDAIDEVLDVGTIQNAICEQLEVSHPVNVEVVSALSVPE
jgi:hypothetical protein